MVLCARDLPPGFVCVLARCASKGHRGVITDIVLNPIIRLGLWDFEDFANINILMALYNVIGVYYVTPSV